MTEIQRYEVGHMSECDDGLDCCRRSPFGEIVKYEDHAAIVAAKDARISELELMLQKNAVTDGNKITALQGQVRVLAAEGKKKSSCLAFFASVIKCGESWSDTCQRDYDAAFKTPVTDAALREIRAQAVEEFAKHLRGHMQDGSPLGLLAMGADEFAARIRTGEQP